MTLERRQRAVLEAMLARLIPADELGPGACDTGVPGYVERSLGAHHAVHRDAYERGLAALDEAARARHRSGFAELDDALADSLLADAERRGDAFFELARAHAIEGFLCDPSWGGNAGQAGWRMLGYPGPRTQWTERDQAIEFHP